MQGNTPKNNLIKKLRDSGDLGWYLSFMRLLFISAGAVIVTLLILLMTRIWGLSQPYQAYEHPFLTKDRPWQAVKISSVVEGKSLAKSNKDVIFWLDLSKTQDGHFLVLNPNRNIQLTPELLKEKFRGPKTFFYDLKFLRLFYDREPLAEEFLASFPSQRFILNILDNAPDVHTAVSALAVKHKAENRILFQSDIELVLKSIKELHPLWLFGTSRSDIMRLLSFDSIGVLPASPFYGDVFISPMKVLDRPAFNENVLIEMRRRKKPVVLGPLQSEAEIVDARSLNPDAYIYENSRLFLKELDQDPAQ